MLDEEIKKRVKAHYKASEEPLLLSNFGKALRVEGLWPVEGETRNLREIIESLRPDIDLIRDQKALAFAVVVSKGKENVGHEAVRARHDGAFLENLPRPVILAFLVKKPDGQNVYLQTRNPFRYRFSDGTETVEEDDFKLVDDKYRLATTFVDRVKDIASGQKKLLADNIRKWAADNDVPLDVFYVRDRKPPNSEPQSKSSDTVNLPIVAGSKSALERLREAQPTDVATRMVVPLDIALMLSRLS